MFHSYPAARVAHVVDTAHEPWRNLTSDGPVRRTPRRRRDFGFRRQHWGFDNALTETINGLYKTEVIKRRGPWRTVDQVEYATAEWVDWLNRRRLYEYCEVVPPAELEASHYLKRSPTIGSGAQKQSDRTRRVDSVSAQSPVGYPFRKDEEV
jgi:hypothetical protein